MPTKAKRSRTTSRKRTAKPAKPGTLPPLYLEVGVDPPEKILSVTVFFAKQPSAALVEAAPSPLHAELRESAIYGCTDEWPDAQIKQIYGTTDGDDDEADEEDWARFFAAIGMWLAVCGGAGAMFGLLGATIEFPGAADAGQRGRAATFELIVPHLTALLRTKTGDGVLFGNLAFSLALDLRDRGLDDGQRRSLIEMGEAAIEYSAHGDNTWRELFEELMPSPRKKPIRRA